MNLIIAIIVILGIVIFITQKRYIDNYSSGNYKSFLKLYYSDMSNISLDQKIRNIHLYFRVYYTNKYCGINLNKIKKAYKNDKDYDSIVFVVDWFKNKTDTTTYGPVAFDYEDELQYDLKIHIRKNKLKRIMK